MARFYKDAKPLLLVILTLPAFLHAATAAAADSAAVKALGRTMLASITDTLADQGWTASPAAEPTVADAGAYDVLTFPALAFRNEGRTLNVGPVTANVVPGNGSGEWKVTLALPSSITMTDAAGKIIMTVNPGTQNFAGQYSVSRRAFTQINAHYKTASIDYRPYGIKASLPELNITDQFSQSGGAGNVTWTGALNIGAVKPRIDLTVSGAALDFEKLNIGINADHYAPDKMRKLQQSIETAGASRSLLLAALKNTVAGAARTSGVTVLAQGGRLTMPAGAAAPAGTSTFSNANISLRGERSDNGMLRLRWTTGFSGLHAASMTPNQNSIIPEQFSIDFDASNLPVDAIAKADTSKDGELAKALAGAHATATLKNTSAGNDMYAMNADGMMIANAKAPLGATGNATMQFYGMETLANALGAEVSNPKTSPELSSRYAHMQAVLVALSLIGQPGKDRQGRPAKIYQIDLMEDGRTMLNGQDMQNILKMATRPAGK